MAKTPIITLLTDFGLADPYVAQMKGVLLSRAPNARIVDITHEIDPGDVLAGGFVLRWALPTFPKDTVHCVVVDPGVGTDRKILVARYAEQTVVFPDNGVISFVNQDLPLERIVIARDLGRAGVATVSSTFHGRDVLAPLAAALTHGLAMEKLGPQPPTFKLLELPQPQPIEPAGVVGQVVYVDRFGNLVTNIPAEAVRGLPGWPDRLEIACGAEALGGLVASYGHAESGTVAALINSMGLVEIAVNGGRACDRLAAGVGVKVSIRPQ